MKVKLFILAFYSILQTLFANDVIVKDFDGDNKLDKVYINYTTNTIVYLLSSCDYLEKQSLSFSKLSKDIKLIETKNGFKLENKLDNVVYLSYFKFNKENNNLELVGINRKIKSLNNEFENGESSYKFSTQELVAKWNYISKTTKEMVSMPTLKTKFILNKIHLDSFNDDFLRKFAEKISFIYKTEISKLD